MPGREVGPQGARLFKVDLYMGEFHVAVRRMSVGSWRMVCLLTVEQIQWRKSRDQ